MSASDADPRRLAFLAQIRAVPAGQVASYGAIARRAGFPRNARMVAKLLSNGGFDDLPWHRILRSDGRIAFPLGSPEYDEQCARLRAEGVEVNAGRVRIGGDWGAEWLDEVLWGQSPTKVRRRVE